MKKNAIKKKYSGWELEHFDNSKNFRKYQYDLIKKYVSKYTAEVGPGNGENLKLYQINSTKVDLYEPSNKLFKNLKKKFKKNNKIKIFNRKFKIKNNKYNTIIYLDVLEHIKRDDKEVIKAFNSLKKKGFLIFNVPAFQHLYSKFDLDVKHYRRYNVKEFLNLIKDLKFTEFKSIYFDSLGYILSLLSKVFLSNYKKNFSTKIKIWDSLIFFSKIIDKITFNSFGKSLLIVIKK